MADWIQHHQTGSTPPPAITAEPAPTSATLGMGPMLQQRQLTYDTASLGRGADSSTTAVCHAPAVATAQVAAVFFN